MVITSLFALILIIAMVFILAVAGFVFVNVFKTFTRGSRTEGQHQGESGANGKRRALEIVSQRQPHAAAVKCGKCGATVDSTAELSADGKVRCNYCNEWSSIL
jgi:CBS domain containing-hemolysin-like protein